MTSDLALVLALLAVTVIMFTLNKPRMDAAALIMMVSLPLTGVINMDEALAGFSNANIVLIAALFVLGEGLVRTGIAQRLGDWLMRHAAGSESKLVILLMLLVGALGSIMSPVGVVAIFIPIVLRIAQSTGIPAGRLMMPLAFAALISGMMTLVSTGRNLVVHSELISAGDAGFSFFSFTPIGLLLLGLAIVYMHLVRPWLAPNAPPQAKGPRRPSLLEWIERYQLAEREYRLRISGRSSLIGQTLRTLNLRSASGATVVAIERTHRFTREVISPLADTQLFAGDVILVDMFSPRIDIDELCRQFALDIMPLKGAYFSDQAQDVGMVEVMIPADSLFINKKISELRLRSDHGLTVIGLRHGSQAMHRNLLDETLKLGDTLLLIGSWKNIRRLQANTKEVVILDLPAELDDVLPAIKQAPHALFSLGVVIGLMVSGIVPNVQAALIGCLLMGLFRCIDLDSAYRALHVKNLILVVGILPFSLALQRTGGIDMAAHALIVTVGQAHTYILLACLFAITAILGVFISNMATAVIMAPVAIAVAYELQASALPFAMIVALAASCAFMAPVASATNAMVMGPGNYRFSDFVRIGVPFTILAMIVSVVLVPWLMPL